MAQGTRVTGNLLHDNGPAEDLFMEVDHGPFVVDNNIFLSGTSLLDMSEGGAFAHNLFAGHIRPAPELGETRYGHSHRSGPRISPTTVTTTSRKHEVGPLRQGGQPVQMAVIFSEGCPAAAIAGFSQLIRRSTRQALFETEADASHTDHPPARLPFWAGRSPPCLQESRRFAVGDVLTPGKPRNRSTRRPRVGE
jgi:hypothetical protein